MLLGHKVMVKMAFRDRRRKRWIYRERVESCEWNGKRGRLEWRHRHCYWQGKVKYHDDDTMTMSKETTHMYKGDLEKYPEDHIQRRAPLQINQPRPPRFLPRSHFNFCTVRVGTSLPKPAGLP